MFYLQGIEIYNRNLKVKLTQDVKGTTGDFLHLGGWLIVHA